MQKRILLKLFIIMISVLFINISPIILATLNDENNNESLTFHYSFNQPVIEEIIRNDNIYQSITIDNLKTLNNPGKPQIPVKEVKILLPPNSQYKDIHITTHSEEIPLAHSIISNGKPITIGSTIQENYTSYSHPTNKNHEQYPKEPVEVIGTVQFRGYSILLLKIYPIQITQNEDNILFSEQISIQIEVEQKNKNYQLLRNTFKDITFVNDIIENPQTISEYATIQQEKTPMAQTSAEDYQYIIITSDELEPYFQPLISYKQNYITATSVNLSYITSNFNGQDLQERIRECIRFAYSNWNTEYVLLGGDIDIIPHRGLYGHSMDHNGEILVDDNIPSDLYYAGLDGTWDNDGDRLFGEEWANSTSEEADFFAEVYVGRAPVEDKIEVETFVNKVISFETSEKPTKIQLHQSGINTRNEPDSTVIPNRCEQWIPNDYTVQKLYQINQEVTSDEWKDSFSDNNLIIEHTGNGERDQYFINWPLNTFTTVESLSQLFNDFYPIHTSVACHSGAFDYDDCIAETILLNPYGGASSCIFNSRWGFTSNTDAHAYSGEFIEQQFYQLFQKGTKNIGKINQFSKEHFLFDAYSNTAYRWCYYTINLLGDPESPVFDVRENSYNTSSFYVSTEYNEETMGWNHTHFNTIQDCIDAASDWDTIYVSSGIYNEPIKIKKPIQLIGENKETTIIDGARATLKIESSQVRIQGFTIQNDDLSLDASRIFIQNSKYITIADCTINSNKRGIYASDTSNLFLINNEFKNNEIAVYVTVKSGSIYFIRNTFYLETPNSYGIYAKANGKYIIQNNTFRSSQDFDNHTCGIFIDGTSEIISNIILKCKIGIWLENGKHQITNNIIKENKQIGIYSHLASATISKNLIEKNGNNAITYDIDLEPGGIIINESKTNTIDINYNIINENRGYGIHLTRSFSSENTIEHNDFINNSIHALYVNSRCRWNQNYWEKDRIFPKIIFGFLKSNSFGIPTIQIDFFPSTTRNTNNLFIS